MVKQRDEEQLKQLAEMLYSLPIDARRKLVESAAEYPVAAEQAEQLSLLLGTEEDTPRTQNARGQAKKGKHQEQTQ